MEPAPSEQPQPVVGCDAGVAGVQAPPVQVPSLQVVPSGASGSEQRPVLGRQTPAAWQAAVATQVVRRGVPPHLPATQVSPVVQASWSLQAVPPAFSGFEHLPVFRSHFPDSWHWSSGRQSLSLLHEQVFAPGVQRPPRQASAVVQSRPSVQVVPLAWFGLVQIPEAGSQTPATWQESSAAQVTVLIGVPHTPAWHFSPVVQRLASSQEAPSALLGLVQIPLARSQLPATWHWSCGLQSASALQLQATVTGTQSPAWQRSPLVQLFPSLQAAPSGFFGFGQRPVAALQTPASWHWSEAAQETVVVGEPQRPAWHVSPVVQSVLSVQGVASGLAGLVHSPVPRLQLPARWHWSSGRQSESTLQAHTLAVGWQTPATQVSGPVQDRPSSQAVLFGLVGLEQSPLVGSQAPWTWH